MKQIIALGGGGFSTEPENELLDTYILKCSGVENPKICYVPTASGDSDICISWFYDFFNKMECQPSHLSLFKPPSGDIEAFVLDKDIIYVGGGNTKNLLVLWKEWGLDRILRKAWEKGIVLAGISAGSICWFEEGLTDSYGDRLEPLECLGFLKGSNCPHYDSEPDRRPAYQELIASGKMLAGIAADDGVAIHYVDDEISRIISSHSGKHAYEVRFEGELIESQIPAEYLGQA
jgi:peptidase E